MGLLDKQDNGTSSIVTHEPPIELGSQYPADVDVFEDKKSRFWDIDLKLVNLDRFGTVWVYFSRVDSLGLLVCIHTSQNSQKQCLATKYWSLQPKLGHPCVHPFAILVSEKHKVDTESRILENF